MHSKAIAGEDVDDSMILSTFTFNSKTGLFDKNSDWDETYVTIDFDAVTKSAQTNAELILGASDISENILRDFLDLGLIDNASHEGQHVLQKSADYEVTKKDPKSGLYQRSGMPKPHSERSHEKKCRI